MRENDIVRHRDNPSWQAVVIKDLHPRRRVNGMVRIAHTTPLGNVHVHNVYKSMLKLVLDN